MAEYLLKVVCGTGSDATVSFMERSEGTDWKTLRTGSAFIGKNGSGKTSEGDGKTPLGNFGVRKAFGILPDPGTALPYLRITPDIYACDEDCPYYNQIIDTALIGHRYGGEHMCEYSPEYDYGMELDFNVANVYPLGSAIFFHCKGGKPYTGGCIAVDEDFMRQILVTADAGLRVEII